MKFQVICIYLLGLCLLIVVSVDTYFFIHVCLTLTFLYFVCHVILQGLLSIPSFSAQNLYRSNTKAKLYKTNSILNSHVLLYDLVLAAHVSVKVRFVLRKITFFYFQLYTNLPKSEINIYVKYLYYRVIWKINELLRKQCCIPQL